MSIVLACLSGFALAVASPWLYRLARGATGWLLALFPAGLFLYFSSFLGTCIAGNAVYTAYPWIPTLGIDLAFFIDGLSLLFALIITGIGALVILYAGEYLHGHPHLGRFYAIILTFMASMLGVVMAGNLITMFIFWELTSISSFLLIGFDHQREQSRAAALQALLVTGAGGLAMLAGLLLIGQANGTFALPHLLSQGGAVRQHPLYLPILLLILLGAFTKSAQVPFHFWLPGAMEAPTPVSAYLHSATMVKAGVYLLVRLGPVLGGTEAWHYLVTTAGAVTMVIGAVLALWQTDLKRILAYSTVSTLGTLVLLIGLDTSLSIKAAMVFLLVHALYKGALFLVAGAVDHAAGSRDITQLGGLARAMPITATAAVLAALSMAGFPPMLGFINKELLYEAKLQAPRASELITTLGILANVALVGVAGIVGVKPFFSKRHTTLQHAHEVAPALWIGPLVLAGWGLFNGLWPDVLVNPLITAAVNAVQPEITSVELKLWHGINPVFGLSVITVIAGVGLFLSHDLWFRENWRAWLLQTTSRISPQRLYELGLVGLNKLARAQTRLLQNGYLRYYLLTIVATTIGLVGYTLFMPGLPTVTTESKLDILVHEGVIAGIIILATIMAVTTRSRLAAIAAMGTVGYGVALLYILFSAPDLAMTQFAIETLTVILFVLVIYRLPRFALLSSTPARIRDALVALLAGGMMSLLVLAAVAGPFQSHLAPYFAAHSLDLAKGRNVVNVILVDFRGFDTLGEITVLSVAALGIFALLKLRKEH